MSAVVRRILSAMFSALVILALAQGPESVAVPPTPQERRLANTRQLTFGGQNAESYWNLSGTKLVFQSRQPGYPDEQIFTMNANGSEKRLVSTGLGRCTCGYWYPDGSRVVFSSTHEREPGPQPPVDMSKGYVWMVNPALAIYSAKPDGTDIRAVVKRNGYVAETTISPDGTFMAFTGGWEGDLDVYRANLDGTGIQRLTTEYGYDGGPFVSWDGKKIVYRRGVFEKPSDREDYRELFKKNLVRPGKLEIWLMDADGSHKRQVTRLGAASFAPFLLPDGKRIIFCTNYADPKRRAFELFLIRTDGTHLERVTYQNGFEGFPMVTRDGKHLAWTSSRRAKPHETNVLVADWRG